MKHNKALGILSVALVLSLVGCGNKGTSTKSSAKPGKTSKPSVSTLPPEPVKEVVVESAALVKEQDGKVAFTIAGTYDLYNAGELKFAWGIADAASNEFVVGKETPEAADYKADGVTLDATAKTFTAKLYLADLTGFAAGKFYNIYAGTQEDTGAAYAKVEVTEVNSMKDTTYNYCVRDDQANAIAIEELPPFAFAEESIVDLTGDHEGRWLKIGGAIASKYAEYTDEQFNALNPAADFQLVGGMWTVSRLTAENVWIAKEGTKAYVYLNVSGLSAGNAYITHLAIKGADGVANCYTDNTIDAEDTQHIYKYESESLQYRFYSNPAVGQAGGEAEYFGCFAVIVEALEAAE